MLKFIVYTIAIVLLIAQGAPLTALFGVVVILWIIFKITSRAPAEPKERPIEVTINIQQSDIEVEPAEATQPIQKTAETNNIVKLDVIDGGKK